MRATIVAPWGERLGGAEQALWTMLRALEPTRVQASVVFLSDGSFVNEVSSLGLHSEVIPAGRLRRPIDTVRLRRRSPVALAASRGGSTQSTMVTGSIVQRPGCLRAWSCVAPLRLRRPSARIRRAARWR
jgi:hypothetical protein